MANTISPDRNDAGLEPKSFDNETYSKVASVVRLKEIVLIGSTYTMNPECFDIPDEEASSKPMNYKFTSSCGQVVIDENRDIISGNYKWIADIKFGRKTGLKLSCNYRLIYHCIAGLDEDHLRFYFGKVGRFTTYPYFRTAFSIQSSESGLMLPPLPTLSERID